MTLEEKVSQMLHEAPAVERLGIPEYNWWNECLHGVARAGVATVFPQAIGLAATWDLALIDAVGTVISDEARAKYHAAQRAGNRAQYFGLTFWSPNINIFRDPRWGRGHETYGEDPFLTSRVGVAFVKALQGDNPAYLKVAANAKHYAVHSGPESERHTFDAVVSAKDLRETYLPAFKALVQEAKVESVMGAYNRTNGELCCGSKTLLQEILRDEWGFEGHVLSDCWAVCDFHLHHKVTNTVAESAALAVTNGCDLNCGESFHALLQAVAEGLISEETIDRSVSRLMTTRMKLGMFDPDERVPYASIPASMNNRPEHRKLARKAACESIVLLKNNGVLPLRKDLNCIHVTGPNALSTDVLLANYNGVNPTLVTMLEGICGKVSASTNVLSSLGVPVTAPTTDFSQGLYWATTADVNIAVVGLTPRLEGEEGDAVDSDGGGDRIKIDLPGSQDEYLKALKGLGKPLVVVVTGGSAIALNWAKENADAIVYAWYPGEEGGNAVADVLFGDYNPAGRLPVTIYKSLADLPPFTEYAMAGRTYRYFEGEPLFPFGFGQSYSSFSYTNIDVPAVSSTDEPLAVAIDVTNTSDVTGDEVVQVYITDLNSPVTVPIRELRAFARVTLAPSETRRVSFAIPAEQLTRTLTDGAQIPIPGAISVAVGGGQPGHSDAIEVVVSRE
jgi:beta-glucosidase